MKKILFISAISLIALNSNAQLSYGGQIGASFASAKSEFTGTPSVSTKLKTKVGFTIGAVAEYEFSSSLSLRPELNFTQKGGKLSETETNTVPGFGTVTAKSTGTLNMSYIELAPNLVYNFAAGSGKVFVGVGPNIAFGIGGKAKYTTDITSTIAGVPSSSTSGDNKIKFDGKKDATDSDDHYKSLDFGLNALAGYKLSNGAFISAGYTIGLSNIDPNTNQSFKNNGFTIKIGYLLGGNKD
jgi:hypothetical protein